MFDSGMMEWLVIVMVALLVLGPQRCMTLLKMLGLMLENTSFYLNPTP